MIVYIFFIFSHCLPAIWFKLEEAKAMQCQFVASSFSHIAYLLFGENWKKQKQCNVSSQLLYLPHIIYQPFGEKLKKQKKCNVSSQLLHFPHKSYQPSGEKWKKQKKCNGSLLLLHFPTLADCLLERNGRNKRLVAKVGK